MRAVAAQVQCERTVEGQTHGKGGAAGGDLPASGHHPRGRRLQVDHVEEPGGGRESCLVVSADVAHGCQGAGETLAPGRGATDCDRHLRIIGCHRGDEIRADIVDDLGAHLHDPQTCWGLLGYGLAFLGQKPDIAVQADRTDAERRPVPQNGDHAGYGSQPAGAVHDDQYVRTVGEQVQAVGPGPRVGARSQLADQLPDTPCPRLVVRPEQDGGVLAFGRTAVRQPAHPVPRLLAGAVRENADRKIAWAVQDGRLRGQPAGQHSREVAVTGDAENAAFRQGDGHRDVRGRPGDLTFVFLRGRVLHDDFTRQVGGAQA